MWCCDVVRWYDGIPALTLDCRCPHPRPLSRCAALQCKGVRVDSCRDLILFVDSALSGIEVVNSKKIKVQVVKSVPSIAIDKTDGILVGVPYACRGAQFVTSKSSEMNVTFPASDKEDADWVRAPSGGGASEVVACGRRRAWCALMLLTHPPSPNDSAPYRSLHPQVEFPIPEQFVTVIKPDGRLSTGVSELYTH